MAQTGYSVLSLYYSATASAAPTAGNLVAGELAINTADGKLFYKDSSGVVQTLATKDATSGSFTNLSYTGTLTGGTGVINIGSGQVYKDASGNVGIGTTSPNAKLVVAGGSEYITNTSGNSAGIEIAANANTPTTTSLFLGQGSTSLGYVYQRANSDLLFGTNNTERMRIDSSGNIGIGTTSPVNYGSGSQGLTINGTGSYQNTTWRVNGVSVAAAYTNGTAGFLFGTENSSPLQFQTAGTERMRIDSSGRLLIGTTATSALTGPLTLSADSGTNKWICAPWSGNAAQFYIAANASYGVYLASASATSWTGVSDERLKTDLKPIENGLDKVNQLRSVTGRFKTDEEGTSRSFLIAQDVQAVLPEAVDATNPEKLGVQYTDVIPLLVASIKELKAELDATKAEVAALKK